MKGAKLMKWFRVWKDLYLIEGGGEQQEGLNIIISEGIFCSDVPCWVFLFRNPTSFLEHLLEEIVLSFPLSGIWTSSIYPWKHKSSEGFIVQVSCSKWRLNLLRSSLYWWLFSVSVSFNLLEECIYCLSFSFRSWN